MAASFSETPVLRYLSLFSHGIINTEHYSLPFFKHPAKPFLSLSKNRAMPGQFLSSKVPEWPQESTSASRESHGGHTINIITQHLLNHHFHLYFKYIL